MPALTLVVLAGIAFFARQILRAYPLEYWLFPRYAGVFALALLWGTSCWSAGDLAVRALMGKRLRASEHVPMAFAVGVVVFGWTTFVFGLLGVLGPYFFVGGPLLLLLLNVRSSLGYLRRLRRHGYFRTAPLTFMGLSAWVLGGAAVLVLYLGCLNPQNVTYDARWYHLPLAEHYAAAGRIARLPEGWSLGAYPQLATYLYSWAMQLPLGRYWDRVELCAHIEVVVFLMTLVGVRPLVRGILPGVSGRYAWAFLFLFPGIFAYDAGLNVGADHLAALFAAPLGLALIRAWPNLDGRRCALLGVVAAGAALTKYTAMIVVIPVGIAVVLRALWLIARGLRKNRALARRAALGALLVLGTGLVVTTPHWLKNWVFYGDPIYPLLHGSLELRPWSDDASLHYQKYGLTSLRHPPRTLEGLWIAVRDSFKFSFGPLRSLPDPSEVPMFGSLFTLGLSALPFLGKRPRLWVLCAGAQLAVVLSIMIHRDDRYLQAALPWMTAALVVTTNLVSRIGILPNISWLALLVLQGIWGSDMPFWKTHPMLGDSPAGAAADLIARGHERRYDDRLLVSEFEAVGAALPRDAKVLIHDWHVHWGLERQSVNDWSPYWGGPSYATLQTPRAMYERMKALGVTHLYFNVTTSTIDYDTLASQLVFKEFANIYCERVGVFGEWRLTKMPSEPPAPSSAQRYVAFFSNPGSAYALGRYRLDDLRSLYDMANPRPADSVPRTPRELLDSCDFAVVEDGYAAPPELADKFFSLQKRANTMLWVKKK